MQDDSLSSKLAAIEDEQAELKQGLRQLRTELANQQRQHNANGSSVRGRGLWKQMLSELIPPQGVLPGTLRNQGVDRLAGSLAGARAGGGAVGAGAAYLVGENGPELFVPTVPGQVHNRQQMQKLSQPVQLTMHVHTPDAGSFRKSQTQIMAELAQAMQRTARRMQ